MHLHWHRTVRAYAQWRLKQCRCGSRRSVHFHRHGDGYSALAWGWPKPDGQAHPRPEGGWPTGPPPLPKVPHGPAPGGARR